MSIIFINSKNSKTSDPHRLLLNLTNKIDFSRKDKYIALSYVSIYYTWKKFKNDKVKTSTPTWNEEFQLPDGSNSISDIQDYYKCILKKIWEKYS